MGSAKEVLGRRHGEILSQWVQALRGQASSEGLTPSELSGLMPEILSSLGRLEVTGRGLTDAQAALVERHMSNRLRQGYTLNAVVTELAVLARCVGDILRGDQGADPAGVLEELYLASLAVAKIFGEHMLEDEQTEKRCARLMARAFNRSAPLRERLDEAMELVRRVLGARTAVLLLHDAADGLVACAAAGDVVVPLAALGGTLDAETFAGQVAARRDEAVAVPDLAADIPIHVDVAIRASGVRSLLGVRLATRDTLWGVLYVGAEETSAFSTSDSRLLADLGETLVAQLEETKRRGAARREIEALNADVARLSVLAGVQAAVKPREGDLRAYVERVERELALAEPAPAMRAAWAGLVEALGLGAGPALRLVPAADGAPTGT